MNDAKQLTADFAQMIKMQCATNARLDQLQATLEIRNQTPKWQEESSKGTLQSSANIEANRSLF